ncbi:MAG: hypothetical protein J5671_04570 [Bacteroidaceae bacterium]|nr:hypothetical protein [Bacteroidaceae bacterium]
MDTIELPDVSNYVSLYANYNSDTEDVDALLNALVTENNVPNDVFENLKLKRLTRFYVPVVLFAGQGTVEFSCEYKRGEDTYREKNTWTSGLVYKAAAYYSDGVPEQARLDEEISDKGFEVSSLHPDTLTSEAQGCEVIFPDAATPEEIVNANSSAMLDSMKEFMTDQLKRELKKQLGSFSNLKVSSVNFEQFADDDEFMPGTTICRQPVTVMEFEYKGQTYLADYRKDMFTCPRYPVDDTSAAVEKQAHTRMGYCAAAAGVVLLLQFLLLHMWSVTLILLLIVGGVTFKFYHDLSQVRQAAQGSRKTERNKVKAADMMADLQQRASKVDFS